jgi:hypothetical protein
MPATMICWAATVPASSVPAAISTVRAAHATSPLASMASSGSDSASASSRSDGPKLSRPWLSRAGENASGARPKPMTSNSSPGEFRSERSAYSLMTSPSSRRWMEVRTSGSASEMNPGLLPVLWIDVPPAAHAVSTCPRRAGSMLPGWWNSPRVVTTLVPEASSRHTSAGSSARGM